MSKSHLKQLLTEELSDVEKAHLYGVYLKQLKSGFWAQSYIDQFMQCFYDYDVSDVMAFMRVHAHAGVGNIWGCEIYVGDTPYADKQVSKNNDALKDLGFGFLADFTPEKGRGADCDGYFYAPEINLTNYATGESQTLTELVLPLEVGYTSCHVTLLHLWKDAGVVRWAYGYDYLTVIKFDDNYHRGLLDSMFNYEIPTVSNKPVQLSLGF